MLVAAVWRQVGYVMVLYLAGLKGTDPSLDDAAAVDGAAPWQRFRFVTWPQLRGVNTVVFAVTVIDSLRTFDIVWAMTQGGPYHSSELLSTYMFQQGFTFLNLGYASAIAVVIFALALIFIITYLVRATGGGLMAAHARHTRRPDGDARRPAPPSAGGCSTRYGAAHPALGRADGLRAAARVPLVRRHRARGTAALPDSFSLERFRHRAGPRAAWAGRCGPASR